MKKFIALLLISFIFIGCSKNTSKDIMITANKDLASKKYVEAVNNFQKVINEFPDSKDAPEALMKLAMIYQSKKISNLDEKVSLEKSANYYKQVFDKYPNNSGAPRALFMAGFIQANELQNYDEAKKIYTIFLEKYPNNELATSAKEEIKNLGVPAEKIIEKKVGKNT